MYKYVQYTVCQDSSATSHAMMSYDDNHYYYYY